MLYIISLIIVIVNSQECFLEDPTDSTKCYLCSYGYAQPTQSPFQKDQCIQQTVVVASATYYISTSCNTNCDGTTQNPYNSLIDALIAIPYPKSGQVSKPQFTLYLKDQYTYLSNSGSLIFLNRRKLVNIVITKDPTITEFANAIIVLKTQKISIFVSGQLTFSDIIFEGLGLNEKPISTDTISCTETLQKTLYNSNTGVSGTSSGMKCGLMNYTMIIPSQSESFGFITMESIFELGQLGKVTFTNCQINNVYFVDSIPIMNAWIQLNEPSIVEFSQVNITNCFFSSGIVSNYNYQNGMIFKLLSGAILDQYNAFRSSDLVSIIFNQVQVDFYNKLYIKNYATDQTGSWITFRDAPISIEISDSTFTNTIQVQKVYIKINGEDQTLGLGTPIGHNYMLIYQSNQLFENANGELIQSSLFVNNFNLENFETNYFGIFQAQTSFAHFNSSELSNTITINNFNIYHCFIVRLLFFSNSDFDVDSLNITDSHHNVIFYTNVFNAAFNYFNFIKIQNSQFIDFHGFYVDDDINELNVLIRLINTSVSQDYYPTKVLLNNLYFERVDELVQYDSDEFYEAYVTFQNIIMKQCVNFQTAWQNYGGWTVEEYRVINITLIGYGEHEQIFNLKIIPKFVLFDNLDVSYTNTKNFINIKSKIKARDDFTFTFNRLTIHQGTIQEIETSLIQTFLKDDTDPGTSLSDKIGTFIISNCDIFISNTEFTYYGFIQVRQPYNIEIYNSTIFQFGTQVFYFVSSNYKTLVQESMLIQNTTLKRQKYIASYVPQPLSQDNQTFYEQYNQLMMITTHKVTLIDSNFIDVGTGFTYFTINSPYLTTISNCNFFNFGVQINQPSDSILIDYIKMTHDNRNTTSFFLQIDGIDIPNFIDNVPPSLQVAPIKLSNSIFQGNLSNGQIQLTRAKIIVDNCTFKCVDLLLSGQTTNPINNLNNVDSLIILKQYAWLYMIDSQMLECNLYPTQKRYCISAYSQSTIEIYTSSFTNSSGANGGFIYTYGMRALIQDTLFSDGSASNGGAIYSTSSTISILQSTFQQCSAIYSGGHINADTSTLTINNCVFQSGQAVDSGGSIYGNNMVAVNILNTKFNNTYQNQAMLFLKSQQISPISMTNVSVSQCEATLSVVAYFYNQQGNITKLSLDQQNNQDKVLLTFIQSKIIVYSLNLINSNFDILFQSSLSNITIQNIQIDNSYFSSALFSGINSVFTIAGITVNYPTKESLVKNVKSMGRFKILGQKSYFIVLENSTLYLNDVTISLMTLVEITQEYQGELLELVGAIKSSFSQLIIQNVYFEDQFYEIDEQFGSSRLLFSDNILSLGAKVIESQSDNIYGYNITLPDFAIKIPILGFQQTNYNFTNITYQFLSLLPQSLMQNYCNSNDCEFIDFRLNQSNGYIFQSNIKSYGISFFLEGGSIYQYSNAITSRNSNSNSKSRAFYSLNSKIQLINVIAQKSTERSYFENSQLTLSGGRISNSSGISIIAGNTTIDGAIFINNTNIIGGAIISQCNGLNSTITIQNTNFTNNVATNSGGALRNIDCDLTIGPSNIFTNNSAPYGNNMLGHPSQIIVQQIIQITDLTVTQLATLSQQYANQIVTNLDTQYLYAIGGQKLQFTVTLVDNFNQIFPVGSYFDSASFISAYQQNETTNTLEFKVSDPTIQIKLISYTFELIHNSIIITEMYIYAKSEINSTIGVYFNSLLIGEITLVMMQCPQGSLSTDDRCFPCPKNTFSLNPKNEKCDNCGDNQICYGKNYIFANAGYFIPVNTSEPIPCPVTESCIQNIIPLETLDKIYLQRFYASQIPEQYTQLSNFISEADIQLNIETQRTNCEVGYQGELCVYCDQSFGQTSDGICYQCSQDSTIYIRFAISTFIILALNYKDTVEPLEEVDPLDPILSNVLFRILTDFSQISNTIVGMSTNISPDILPIFAIFSDQISFFPSDFDSGFACFFLTGITDQIVRYKYKLLISAIIPWAYISMMIGLVLLIDKAKSYLKTEGIPSQVSMINIIVVSLVASLYNFYMYLAQSSLSIFSCLTINDYELGSKVVLNEMTDIQCWEKEHLQLIFIFGLPTIIGYLIGIPLLFVFFVQKYFQKTQNLNNSFMIGKISQEDQSLKSDEQSRQSSESKPSQVNYSIFLTRHLKDNYKYWGVYIQLKKLIINIILVVSITIDTNTAAILVLIVFIMFMLISYKYQPYKEQELNKFEGTQDIIVTLIIHLTLLLIQTKDKSIQIFASVFILIFKFYFYYSILKIIVNEYLQYFRKKAKQVARSQTSKVFKSQSG